MSPIMLLLIFFLALFPMSALGSDSFGDHVTISFNRSHFVVLGRILSIDSLGSMQVEVLKDLKDDCLVGDTIELLGNRHFNYQQNSSFEMSFRLGNEVLFFADSIGRIDPYGVPRRNYFLISDFYCDYPRTNLSSRSGPFLITTNDLEAISQGQEPDGIRAILAVVKFPASDDTLHLLIERNEEDRWVLLPRDGCIQERGASLSIYPEGLTTEMTKLDCRLSIKFGETRNHVSLSGHIVYCINDMLFVYVYPSSPVVFNLTSFLNGLYIGRISPYEFYMQFLFDESVIEFSDLSINLPLRGDISGFSSLATGTSIGQGQACRELIDYGIEDYVMKLAVDSSSIFGGNGTFFLHFVEFPVPLVKPFYYLLFDRMLLYGVVYGDVLCVDEDKLLQWLGTFIMIGDEITNYIGNQAETDKKLSRYSPLLMPQMVSTIRLTSHEFTLQIAFTEPVDTSSTVTYTFARLADSHSVIFEPTSIEWSSSRRRKPRPVSRAVYISFMLGSPTETADSFIKPNYSFSSISDSNKIGSEPTSIIRSSNESTGSYFDHLEVRFSLPDTISGEIEVVLRGASIFGNILRLRQGGDVIATVQI